MSLFSSTNWAAENVAPCGSRITVRREYGASTGGLAVPPSSTALAAATAAKAVELGGTASPPVDAPYSRLTVIRDPQGATFSAAQFVLENKDIGRAAAS